jgi:hypothetical protein
MKAGLAPKKNPPDNWKIKKNGKRPTSHRSTAYPCYVPILGESAGAGRVGLAVAKVMSFYSLCKWFLNLIYFVYCIFKIYKNEIL